jgi:hypothetical protein
LEVFISESFRLETSNEFGNHISHLNIGVDHIASLSAGIKGLRGRVRSVIHRLHLIHVVDSLVPRCCLLSNVGDVSETGITIVLYNILKVDIIRNGIGFAVIVFRNVLQESLRSEVLSFFDFNIASAFNSDAQVKENLVSFGITLLGERHIEVRIKLASLVVELVNLYVSLKR